MNHCIRVASTPEVFLIDVPYPNVITRGTNCYVVKDGDDCLVVDLGAPSDEGYAYLMAAFDELGIDPSRARYFLTHLHMDHAGLVDRVVPADAPLYLSRIDFEASAFQRTDLFVRQLEDRIRAEGASESYMREAAAQGLAHDCWISPERNLRFVGEGDMIDVGRFSLHVVETPGHTQGHLTLFEPESRVYFGGDHILFVLSPGLRFSVSDPNTLQNYLDSLRKVQDLQVSRLFHSHGEIEDGVNERIDWLIGHRHRRVEQTWEAIKERPGITGTQAIRLVPWNTRGKSWNETPILLKQCILENGMVVLDHLVNERRIARRVDGTGAFRYEPA